jgi:drug/metabolite transporter (DMT)-like permease
MPSMSDDRKAQLDGKAVALLLMCCALWGLGQVAAKVTLAEIPPLMQAALRSAGAALLVLAWMRFRRLPLALGDGTAPAGLLAGLLFAAEFACIFLGLQHTTASRMAVFIYLAPFVVALGMPLIARSERLRGLQVVGLVGAFAGVVWAFAEGFTRPAAGERQWLGDALGIGGALLWGATTLALRATSLGKALPEKALLYQLVVSALALGAAAAATGESWPARLSSASLVPLAFQTIVITFFSYLVWFWLVRHYPATRISAFTLLTPLFGLLAGVLLLGDALTLRLLVALAAVCVGIALVNRAPAAKPPRTG